MQEYALMGTLVLKIAIDLDPTITDPEEPAEIIMDLVINEINAHNLPFNYETWSAEWE